MILNNIEKPFNFHFENFKANKIKLTQNQIKWQLQKIREENFPNDNEILKGISLIKITYENNIKFENLPLCYKSVNMIIPDNNNNNKLEKFIIFTSKLQLNMLTKCNQILIDGTFKSCPKGYYQIFNIAGYNPELNTIIPIFKTPTTGKSYFLFNTILEDVKKIIINNDIKIENIPNKIIIDFEKSLQNSKKNFPNSVVDGCYFRFVKLLLVKAKNLGICKKEKLKNTKIVIFVLKLIPFLKEDDKFEVFEKIEELFSNKENGYGKMVAYFRKNWIKNNYINYNNLSEDEYINSLTIFLNHSMDI